MRSAVMILAALLAVGCNRQPENSRPSENKVVGADSNAVGSQPPASAPEPKVTNEAAIPVDTPDDPALGELSPSRRREYERGYRDCRGGNYNYDPDRLGEFYRIGCMAAENAKAGVESNSVEPD